MCIADTPAAEQPGLVVRKLQQCCVVFNFDDPLADVKSKEVKRGTLNELVSCLNDTKGLLTEAVCADIVHMVRIKLYTCIKLS
jgi:serine/threonine-protein phosphatase 2A regulatory subunit B'